jgi:uncharacterized protein YecE (DUF72 family)
MKSEYYFGIAGWSYPDWIGVVYPSKRNARIDELSYLAEYFDSIELNNTFYRIPVSKIVESWAKRVSHNSKFRFTAKLWQGFTHDKKGFSEADVTLFRQSMDPLMKAGRLGCVLLQFPVSFVKEKSNEEKLARLVETFSEMPLVLEFRHRSWVAPETFQWMEDQNVGFCNVDEPMFRKMLRPSSVVTGKIAYVRLHGRNYKTWFAKDATRDTRYDYLYSDDELDEWVPRIREMKEKAKDVYVIGNNHFRGQAPANVLQLQSKTIQEPVDVPQLLLEAYPQLGKIAKTPSGVEKKPSSK